MAKEPDWTSGIEHPPASLVAGWRPQRKEPLIFSSGCGLGSTAGTWHGLLWLSVASVSGRDKAFFTQVAYMHFCTGAAYWPHQAQESSQQGAPFFMSSKKGGTVPILHSRAGNHRSARFFQHLPEVLALCCTGRLNFRQ